MGSYFSFLGPKVDHEVEVLSDDVCRETLESLEGVFLHCNSKHSGFLRRDEYTIDHLPKEIRHWAVDGITKLNSDLTVRVIRPATPTQKEPSNGSGSICYFSDTGTLFPCTHGDPERCNFCHIPDCKYTELYGSDHYLTTNYKQDLTEEQLLRSHLAFRVSTNEHVVANCEDASRTIVELFFDSPRNRETVVTAHGVCLCGQWQEQDKVHIVCVADRNQRLQDLLQSMREDILMYFKALPEDIKHKLIYEQVILVSHPHGTSKRISFGKNWGSQKMFSSSNMPYIETRYDAESCSGSSGGVVLGPGWVDGGPSYRVHCGRFEDLGHRLSKSYWVVAEGEAIDNKANYVQEGETMMTWVTNWITKPFQSLKQGGGSNDGFKCCPGKTHKAMPTSL